MACILVLYAFDGVDVDIFCYRVDQTLKCLTLKKIGFYFGKGWIRKDHPCNFLRGCISKNIFDNFGLIELYLRMYLYLILTKIHNLYQFCNVPINTIKCNLSFLKSVT
jgi:hypothetical protein